jgi:DNA-binding MarR family transcriptional regulator
MTPVKTSPDKTSLADDLEIGPACLAYRTRMLSRVISAIYDEALAPLNLKGSQVNVLSVLARRGPSAQTELCAVLKMEKSTLSRNIERMRRRGWLSADVEEGNRTHVLSLTPRGAKLLRDASPLWRKAQAEASRRIGSEGVAALDALIKHLRAFEDAERRPRNASPENQE